MDEILKNETLKLTSAQKKVVKFVYSHLNEAIFMTASALGRKTGVSEATIIRLAQALGFEGFPAFQKHLRRLQYEKFTTVKRLEKTLDLPGTANPFVNTIQMDIKNISAMAEAISEKTFSQVVTQLWKAKQIRIIGLRSAFSLAVYLKFGLRFLGKETTLIQPSHGDLWDQLAHLSRSDLVVGISFPRYSNFTVDAVALAKEKKCKIIAVTDTFVSPLTPYSDWVLVAPCQSDSYMDSFTAPMGLLHALLTAMSLKKPEIALTAFKRLETLWDRQHVYFSPPEA
jgi:DNA-binding MurR/RpiR family transcriptional regulator